MQNTSIDLDAPSAIRHKGGARSHQVYLLLREEILRGRYAPEAQLPAEKLLAQQYGVARITIRKALDQLADEDLVRRVHGSGTFVSDRAHPATLRGQIEGFVRQADWLTRNTTVELLNVRDEIPPPQVAQAMGIAPGESVQRSLRLRSYLGKPCLLLDTFMPRWAADLVGDEELRHASLNTALRRAGVEFASADYTVSAAPADSRLADVLRVPVAAALMTMIWAIRDRQDRVIEYQQVYARPDVYVLHTVLKAD